MRQSLRSAHPTVQFLVLVLLGFAATFVLGGMATGLFYLAGYGDEALQATQNMTSPTPIQVLILKLYQIVQAIGLFAVPYILYRIVLEQKGYALIRTPFLKPIYLLVFLVAMLSAFPLINFITEWNGNLVFPIDSVNQWIQSTEQSAEKLIQVFLQTDSFSGFLFNLTLLALTPAIAEELLFRGTLQPLMLKAFKQNFHMAIWVTAFWFSFIHLQFLGFFPRLLLGAVLGYAAHWSGSLLLPMLGHFVFNGLAVTLAYFIGTESLSKDIETFGAHSDDILFTALSAVIVLSGMWLIRSRSTFNVVENEDPENASLDSL
jgi:uncharacterized protein